MGIRATGTSGEVRYGYQVALRLGQWTIDAVGDKSVFNFTAFIADTDEVWAMRTPLDLVLALGPFEWIWRDIPVVIADGKVTIELLRRPDIAQPRFVEEPTR